MTDLEYLKEQDKLHGKYWDEKFAGNVVGQIYSNHIHMCDFEILQKLYPKAHKRGWHKYQCKQYLKQFGKNRDINLNCCDYCPHMRYIDINDDNFILSITTSYISDERYPFLDKEMVEKI